MNYKTRAFLSLMAVLLLFLILIYLIVVPHQENQLKISTEKHIEHSLAFTSNAVTDALLREDYLLVQEFILNWGKEHEDIYSIKSYAPNGFVFVEYTRDFRPEGRTFSINKKVIYEDRLLITMEVVADFTSSNALLKTMNKRIYFTSTLFMIIMGITLLYSLNKITLAPMTKEIERRKAAEDKLQKAHNELEQRVNERTRELKSELAERIKTEEKYKTSLKEKEVLIREVHHRVKNNMAVIAALNSMQMKMTDDLEARKMLSESNSRIKSMALVHEILYNNEDLSNVNVKSYFGSLVEYIGESNGINQSGIALNTTIGINNLPLDTLIPCGLITSELVTNALKYAFIDSTEGQVDIELRRDNDNISLIISDNGSGLPEGFKPENTNTLGYTLINALTEQLEGEMELTGSDGTRCTIIFTEASKSEVT